MAVNKYFFKSTQTLPGTGGIGYDLSLIQGTSATLNTATLNSTIYTEMLWWQVVVNKTISTTSFPTSMDIGSITGTIGYRWRIQQVNSSNTVVASSAYSTIFTTTGVNTETLTLSTTWAAGDRFRLSFEIARTAGHGLVSAGVLINDADSFAEIDQNPVSVGFLLMF